MRYPKVLLIVNSNPQGSGVGEIFLRDLARAYPSEQLVRFSTVPGKATRYEGEWHRHPVYTEPVAMSAWPVVSSYRELQFHLKVRQHVMARVETICAKHQVDLIWCVANSPSIISLAHDLMQKTQLPFVTTVWDTPEYFILNQWLDPVTAWQLRRKFAEVLQRSLRVSVTGEAMREMFLAQYGVHCISCLHGVDPQLVHEHQSKLQAADQLTIAFAGSLYAKREWNALLRAVESAHRRIIDRKVVVRFIGRFPRTFARSADFVEQLGVLSQEETIAALATADIAYLPYWFISRRRYVVKTAFPSKLSSYLAAGLPILYHGPQDSSPTHFLATYPIGIACHSLRGTDILNTLNRLVTDDSLIKEATTARQKVLAGVLSQRNMLDSFAALLGLRAGSLLPLANEGIKDH